MKKIQVISSVKIPLIGGKESEEGEVRLIFEIPYSKLLFKGWNRADELSECLVRGKEVLENQRIKTRNKEDTFIKIEQQTYGFVMQQLVDYLAATQTTGASSQAILLLLQSHIEQARIEATEILKRDMKNAEEHS